MRILVALDGSDHALVGLSFVAALPLGTDDEVILVSVAEQHDRLMTATDDRRDTRYAVLLERSWARRRATARRIVERARGAMRLSSARVATRVLSGHPVSALADIAGELAVDLIVVGTRGRGVAASMVLGSVTHSLLGSVDRPVLVARPSAGPIRRVLLAVDGSAHSRAAADLLTTFPLPEDAVVDVVVVASGGVGEVAGAEREIAASVAEPAAELLRAAGRGGATHLVSGDARREITRLAIDERADLVVLGTRGIGGFRGLLLGSVSRGVVTTAACSVMVVPSR
jgi:nucleotide-binding universal stress UspA family protein